jgi:squalene-hopene/tetraprenyl-beta-curcumene cyclase
MSRPIDLLALFSLALSMAGLLGCGNDRTGGGGGDTCDDLAAELTACSSPSVVDGFLEACERDTAGAMALSGTLCDGISTALGDPCAFDVECNTTMSHVCRPVSIGSVDGRCALPGRARHTVVGGACGEACDTGIDCASGLGCTGGMCVATGSTAAAADACRFTDRTAAATFLAERSSAWQSTYPCTISCHTTVPFLLATPLLGSEADTARDALLADVEARALGWSGLDPWYGDEYGAGKATESRSTEAVLNALVLTRRDRVNGAASDASRAALDAMWATQTAEGDFTWLDFGLLPWEDSTARPAGMAFAALAAAAMPGDYLATATGTDREHIDLLRGALRAALDGGVAFDRVFVLWAATEWPDLLTAEEREGVIAGLRSLQRADGGWNLAELGEWRARAGYPTDSTASATAITTFVLIRAGVAPSDPAIVRATEWLLAHRGESGTWADTSINRDDPFNHGLATDAATAFAILALDAATGDL